jgi:tetratricopeptide (TPR) repeat protein
MKKPRQRDADRALAGAIESANSHFEAGRLADAERAYRAVLALAAAHADALGQLGLILHAQGRDQEAADHLAASIKANPRKPATWPHWGATPTRWHIMTAPSSSRRASPRSSPTVAMR